MIGGMSHPLNDITNQKFGKLTAIERIGTETKTGAATWRFACSCGATVIRTGTDARRNRKLGVMQSCRRCSAERGNNLRKIAAITNDERLQLHRSAEFTHESRVLSIALKTRNCPDLNHISDDESLAFIPTYAIDSEFWPNGAAIIFDRGFHPVSNS